LFSKEVVARVGVIWQLKHSAAQPAFAHAKNQGLRCAQLGPVWHRHTPKLVHAGTLGIVCIALRIVGCAAGGQQRCSQQDKEFFHSVLSFNFCELYQPQD
jgi:hypothetical protein